MQSDARVSAGVPFLRRYRGALTFTVAVLVLLGAWFGGNWLYAEWAVGKMELVPIEAGRVNLFGVELSGERIIVANGTAMLIRGSGVNDKDAASGDDARGPAVPIRALIGSLNGDEEALSELLESLNDIDPTTFPPPETVWEEEQLRAALRGDRDLLRKLERQLGTTLRGEPADRISLANLRAGITVRVRVPVQISVEGAAAKKVEGVVRVNYRTRFAQEVLNNRVIRDTFDPTEAALYGVVREVWAAMEDRPHQDVRADLESLLDEKGKARLAHPVESLLSRTTILATEREITDASLREYDDPTRDRSLFALQLTLTDHARYRLWKYTRGKGQPQLLFAVDGVAVAAPIVQHEMKYSVVEILNVSDEVDARKAVQVIKELHEKK